MHEARSTLPLGWIACGRGLRRAGRDRLALASEYDAWTPRRVEDSPDSAELLGRNAEATNDDIIGSSAGARDSSHARVDSTG